MSLPYIQEIETPSIAAGFRANLGARCGEPLQNTPIRHLKVVQIGPGPINRVHCGG